MCVTITQMVGYSVPTKKVKLIKGGKNVELRNILDSLDHKKLSNGSTIFYVFEQSSTCECGDSDGNGREFRRDTYEPLTMDEDDEKMHDIETLKIELKQELENIGLSSWAVWGYFTDAYADSH